METPLKAKTDEKNISNLSIIIKVTRNKKFNWDRLRAKWQEGFGGKISERTKLERRYWWSFTWQNVDYQKVLEQAEKGNLDKDIVSEGGGKILEILENEECIYQFIPNITLQRKKSLIKDVDQTRSKKLAADVDVLLITVTNVETNAVLNAMKPWPEEKEILRGSPSLINYWFGQFGRYRAAHCTCTMGGGGRSGSAQTTADAINELQPKAVLLLGIAFGVDRKSQRLGDVIVADSIYSYDLQKVGPDFTLSRGSQTNCGTVLSERFRNYSPDWELKYGRSIVLTGKRTVKVFQGLILSGKKLINNKKFRDDLLNLFQGRDKKASPYGGEMEGAGAYEARERLEAKLNERFEIILIKAICDWADGEKNDRAQPFAAYSAVSLAKHVLSKPSVLAALSAKEIPPENRKPTNFSLTLNNQGKIIKQEPIKVKSFVEKLGNDIKLEMVLIPGGSFQMGANENIEEQSVHTVKMQPFFMSKYPITQEQWKAVANLDKVNIDLKLNPSKFIGKNLPVERVNWYDAKEFCARLSRQTNLQYRLPSEAEWEYACRAGSTTPFYFGETMTTDVANYDGNYIYADEPKGEYREKTTPVGNFPPNAFGLCDMHGNVWEWCEDPWHSNYEGAPTDGTIWQESDSVDNNCDRLLRGGSWYQKAKDCRCACRNHIEPYRKWKICGFRIVVIKI